MIGFSHTDEVNALRDRVLEFVDAVVIPAEPRDTGQHGPSDELRSELQEEAKRAGVFAPQVPVELGGHGVDLVGQCAILEAAGRSLLGPQALNCAAPDEGNMNLLEQIATPEQKERWLGDLTGGAIRSCFAMTEPAPGAGSDPGMLQATATKTDGGWVINGHKWYITGADGASVCICMARTGEEIVRGRGATMFLVDMTNPGVKTVRLMDTVDRCFAGGHAELRFEDCEVSDADVLGELGLGYEYAQVRLGPARLTHCMRWTGLATRALEITRDHVAEREAFGMPLSKHGKVIDTLAECLIDLETSRLVTLKAAWKLQEKHPDGLQASSLAKAHCGEAVSRVADQCSLLLGGLGVNHDSPVARMAQEIRPFRVYDGPTDVHKWSIGRRFARAAVRKAT